MKGMKLVWLFRFIVTFLLIITYTTTYCQISGCTDPLAKNYKPGATLNDGSCTYKSTHYSPRVKVSALNKVLNESGGLQMAGDFLWSFNDGGGEAALYRIDTLSNALLQTVYLEKATNIDW